MLGAMKMLLVIVGLGLLWLSGCNTAHPLDGLHRSGTAAGGEHRYRVNWNAEVAQAVRLNPAWRPAYPGVRDGAVAATEALTGCRATPDRGDLALVRLSLDCAPP